MMGKRWMKKITIAILMAALVLGAVPANEAQAASKPKLNVTSLKMKAGQSKQLKVKNSSKKVTWSSNKKSVAAVSKKGKVTAKKAGKATITAQIGKTKLKCKVAVTKKSAKKKVLVVYFSATGSTERVAKIIKDTAKADIYEIRPKKRYTDADLDWTEESSRVNKEHDSGSEPAISGKVSNLSQYDVVYLGYPIWWGEAPNIMHTFLKKHNLSGKTVIPFCTSLESGLGSSAANLHQYAPNAKWQKGRRFDSDASRKTVEKWVKGLKY